jgi:hypothetical protein
MLLVRDLFGEIGINNVDYATFQNQELRGRNLQCFPLCLPLTLSASTTTGGSQLVEKKNFCQVCLAHLCTTYLGDTSGFFKCSFNAGSTVCWRAHLSTQEDLIKAIPSITIAIENTRVPSVVYKKWLLEKLSTLVIPSY